MSDTYVNGAEERAPAKRKLKLDDDDFLSIVKAERNQAIGMETGDDILEEREKALQYYKGQMNDVPALAGRSRVVDSAVSDAVHTALPDLVEIFIGGEEIGSFRPVGEEDVEAAKQETEVVNHVIMAENDGFSLVHDAIHDALLTKVGVIHSWAEKEERDESEELERVDAVELQMLSQMADVSNVVQIGLDDMTGLPIFSATVTRKYEEKCIKLAVVAPEDFAVARDTVRLKDTTYCCMRTRPRAQDLKAKGFDPDVVDGLPGYSATSPELIDQARDLAGEHRTVTGASDSTHDLRQVVVYVHVVRVDAYGTGKPQIWRVDTDEMEGTVLQKMELNAIPFAAGTPYKAPHRFYGRSLADLLMEVQKIKTALMRMALDAGYFGLNQRVEVSSADSDENTISDLLRNEPGVPVRSKTGNAIKPIQSGGVPFDAFQALEYFSTVGEGRSGIVRNAQGLNPDTLHDTAKGAQMLMAAAQRRLRLIARTLAETLFKDLFVNVHGLLKEHGSKSMTVRIRNQWVTVDPTTWGARKDMTVEIGMGGGREHDLMLLAAITQDMAQIVEAQSNGALDGKVVSAKNIYALATKKAERAGLKGVSEFFTDPEANPEPKEPPPPDPAIVKAEMEMQAQQAEMEMRERHTQMQFEKDMKLSEMQQRDDMARAEIDARHKEQVHELAVFQAQRAAEDAERKHQVEMARIQLDMDRMRAEMEAKQRELDIKERDISVREREMEQAREIEIARLEDGREARAYDIADRQSERQMRAAEPRERPEPKGDRNGEAIGKGLEALAQAMSRPKKLIRGEDGRPEGIE